MVVTLLGCNDPILNAGALDERPTVKTCPDLNLKHASVSTDAFENLVRSRPNPVSRTTALNAVVRPMVRGGIRSVKQRIMLKRAALQFTQQTTLEHFMDYGRLLAHAAIGSSNKNVGIEHPSDFDPQAMGAFFAALVDVPPPLRPAITTQDKILRYILYMWSWVGLLDDRFQLDQWWQPWEYRWILEARVLGHFGLSIPERLKANTALKNTTGYPHDWNAAVLNVWANNRLSDAMRQTLSSVVSMTCMKQFK